VARRRELPSRSADCFFDGLFLFSIFVTAIQVPAPSRDAKKSPADHRGKAGLSRSSNFAGGYRPARDHNGGRPLIVSECARRAARAQKSPASGRESGARMTGRAKGDSSAVRQPRRPGQETGQVWFFTNIAA
jgi:hypothetical protein